MRGRYFTIFSVLLILIALPALSWLYLNKGADWRRAGLAEMANKKPLTQSNTELQTASGTAVILEEGEFFIASNLDASKPANNETLNKLAEQFNHQGDLTFLYLGETNVDLAEEWMQVACLESPCGDIVSQLFTENTNTALIDDSLYVRGVYDLTIPEEVLTLVEHGAILFPIEKRKKIELKRGANQ